jgi:predicted O-methyltransferase YrrM
MPSLQPEPGQDAPFDEPVAPLADTCVTYADEWLDEEEQIRFARARAHELGCPAVSRTVANTLTLLARAIDAKAVVEIGTGAGVSAAALLAGMSDAGVLTSIDIEADHQRVTRETLASLGFDHVRFRLIAGRALEVLPRLADGAYDLMFVDADLAEYPAILAQARRLLRIGGLIAFDDVLASGLLPDPSRRDAETAALRETVHEARDDNHWHPSLLPIGGGLLVAMRRSAG